MKTVLFVPGFKENYNSRDYAGVIKAIKNKGYDVKFVTINWLRSNLDDWAESVNSEYQKHDPNETILAGFSFGAMSVLKVAANKSPSELWLFSLSCFFSEDIPKMPKSWLKDIGINRVNCFLNQDFKKMAKNINCKTLIFIGEQEIKTYPLMKDRAESANKLMTNNRAKLPTRCGP